MEQQEVMLQAEKEAEADEKLKYNISKMILKIDKEKEKLGDSLSSGRFATLYEANRIMLGKDLTETIANLTNNKAERKDFEMLARIKKQKFYLRLCLRIQKNFPLENSLLSNLVFIDLAKIYHDKPEAALKAIWGKIPEFMKEEGGN